ncbi:hypothetical protein [Streptacidiphilus neutrinimicus]|nr:hypothetical protein [Streptacidiphilus neutrinimicus]
MTRTRPTLTSPNPDNEPVIPKVPFPHQRPCPGEPHPEEGPDIPPQRDR